MASPQERGLEDLKRYVVETVVPTLSVLAESTSPSADSSSSSALESRIRRAAAAVEHAATSFAVAYEGPPENPEECVPAAGMLESALGELSASVVEAGATTQSRTVASRLRVSSLSLSNSILDLVDWMINQRNERRPMAPVVAVVWESCKALQECSLVAKIVSAQEIVLWTGPIKDAVEELEEVEEVEEGDGDSEDEDDQEGLTAEELEPRPGLVSLSKIGCLVVQKVAEVVLEPGTVIECARLDELVRLSSQTSALVDDAVCSVYRPQDRSAVVSNSSHLCQTLHDLCSITSSVVPAPDDRGYARTLELLASKASDSLRSIPH